VENAHDPNTAIGRLIIEYKVAYRDAAPLSREFFPALPDEWPA
jgi:hypothetical protein